MQHLYILVAIPVLYFGWRAWPFLRRKIYCPWCWKSAHMQHRFPAKWSSTICRHHQRRMLAQAAARRRRKLKAVAIHDMITNGGSAKSALN